MDTLKGLQAFVKVVELGSFVAAADRLELSRSALTKIIASLERQYSARLLQRTTRRLSLTEAGRTLYEGARPLLGELAALEQRLLDGTEQPRGTLKVSAPLSFGVLHLAPAVSAFMTEYPDVQVDLELSDRQVNLVEDGFDLAIRIGRLEDSSLIAVPLGEVRLLVAAAPSYLTRRGTPKHPSELKGHDCLLYSYARDGHDWNFQQGEETLQIRVTGPLRANNGSVLRTAALAGHGIVWQPDFLIGGDVAAGRLVRLFPEWRSHNIGIQAVYPHRRLVPAKVKRFIAWLQQRQITFGYLPVLP